jgi:putative DNA primase/helicase
MSVKDGLKILGFVDESSASVENGGYPANDSGNAKRFIDYTRDKLRFVPEWGTWLIWGDHHWKRDADGAVYRLAEKHSMELLRKVADYPSPEEREKKSKQALNLGKRSTIENMLALARYHEKAIIHENKLDADPWLLGVQNGVVDLKTGSFRPGAQSDSISRTVGCEFVPGAKCNRFEAFLSRIMAGDAAMIEYLWRIIGYCLTGSDREQSLFFFHGNGKNGKSTLKEVLAKLMGDYGSVTTVDLIVESRNGKEPETLIAALQGKRMVSLPEVEAGHKIAQSRLKTLTGGDSLCGRQLYEKHFQFRCTSKLIVHGNSKPEVQGVDNGIWRRFRLIPFGVTIPPDEVDHDLALKLISELPGILNRALEACLAWQKRGLETPQLVVKATEEYRDSEDVLAEFLEEFTVPDPRGKVSKPELYALYSNWTAGRIQRPVTPKRFAQLISQRGFLETRSNSTRFWLGLARRG